MLSLNKIFSPITLFLALTLIGTALGKLKICRISLGHTGVLISSVFFGYLTERYLSELTTVTFNETMSAFSKLGMALFVSVIALSSVAPEVKQNTAKNVLCYAVGSAAVFAGFAVTKLIENLDNGIDHSLLLGLMCGALTSTPGLSSVCDMRGADASLATLGYGVSYLFGSISVIVLTQCLLKRGDRKVARCNSDDSLASGCAESLIIIAIVYLTGQIIGGIEIPYIKVSLGGTGGVLLSGVALGKLVKRFIGKKIVLSKTMMIFKEFGLVMFFVGNGFIAGQNLNFPLQIKWLLYSTVITLCSLATVYFLSRFLSRDDNEQRLCIISGGMTNTPALNIVVSNSKQVDITPYCQAYLGALITITLGVGFM